MDNRIDRKMYRLLRYEIARQKDRLILWLPVFLGLGISFYFALDFEPPPLMTAGGFGLVACLLAACWPLREKEGAPYVVWGMLLLFFLVVAGFSLAQLRTLRLSTTMLEKPVGPSEVEGKVVNLDLMEEGSGERVILSDLRIEDLKPEETPQTVRIKIRKAADIRPGDRIRVLAKLNPPSAPIAPHAFDFQRYAYFRQLGGFGFALGEPEIIDRSFSQGSGLWLETLRHHVAGQVDRSVNGPAAAVMIALMTGERAGIAQEDWDDMRDSGLAHMLAISGLHVGLVAGVIFFIVRLVMAAAPHFALYHPIKKYAAFFAFFAALFYTMLVGATIPTLRALIMVSVVLLAVVLDRTALSLRLVALAALVVLVIWPEALWGASFQMSFAAVTALVIFYDSQRERLSRWYRRAGLIRKLALYILGLSATTVIATLATMPFALYHFQQLALFSLPANLLAMPVMSFVVMPAAVLSYVLMPFGLASWPLWLMNKGVDAILYTAGEIAALPHATWRVAAWPDYVLFLLVLGGVFLLFWQGWGKMTGLALVTFALISTSSYRPPDLLVSSEGKLVAIRDERGLLHVSTRRYDRFVSENWYRRNGQDEQGPFLTFPVEGMEKGFIHCGEQGCYVVSRHGTVAVSYNSSSHGEDCSRAAILVAYDPVRVRDCASDLVIDRFDTWRNGAYAVWFDGRYETVAGVRGHRPWTISNGR